MNHDPLPQVPDLFPETIKPAKFKRGDVVRLNSEPVNQMTVVESHVTADFRAYNCWWFVPSMEVTNAEFPEDCLTLVTP